jgi:hypothetical protein
MPNSPYRRRNWSETTIAVLHTGFLCPDCHTAEEFVQVEVDEIDRSDDDLEEAYELLLAMPLDEALAVYTKVLVASYRTPAVMRCKADELQAARPEHTGVVWLMRRLAEDMEAATDDE